MTQSINTRVAPSPTGMLHLGTVRTMYHNWLIAKATGGKFVVRIDDTDEERSRDEFIKPIFDTLDFLGLDYDYTFKQSPRKDFYMSLAEGLVREGRASVEDNGAIRLNENQLILIKGDGMATYNFASTVDDLMSPDNMSPNLILRGIDHMANLPKQRIVADNLALTMPEVTHVGLMMKPKSMGGGKLSKRDSDSMLSIFDYHPQAILNFVLRLGWSPKQDDKSNNLIDKDKAIGMIMNDGNFRAANMTVDMNKLAWYQKKYRNY